ncbi:dienelactone hydrolase [Phycomyces nitens]|nr:dienelactone hydrolase [Phycomyces nitens]
MSLPFKIFSFDPKGTKNVPNAAIIVLQEWWGVNDQIKRHAQRIADNTGAHVVVPDLYKGKIGLTAEEASHLMNNLDWQVAIKELEQLVSYLRDMKKKHIGAIGFCMGGALSLALATTAAEHGNPIQVAITCYGIPGASFDVKKITKATSVQGHFGGKDQIEGFSDPVSARKLEVDVAGANDVHIYHYPDQGHAFLNDDEWSIAKRKEIGMVDKTIDPLKDEKPIRDLAWSRIFDYFDKHLA